jgi:hypothetical protein
MSLLGSAVPMKAGLNYKKKKYLKVSKDPKKLNCHHIVQMKAWLAVLPGSCRRWRIAVWDHPGGWWRRSARIYAPSKIEKRIFI